MVRVSPDAHAVLRLDPQPVARGGLERRVELVEVADDVGPQVGRRVRVDGEQLLGERLPRPCPATPAPS